MPLGENKVIYIMILSENFNQNSVYILYYYDDNETLSIKTHWKDSNVRAV